ncbi:hypothetical protein B1756_15535 [Natrarchaeobaculum aegyptiacum]|uniref:Uncharacterized protein n=1 Tax=Natrarchaeobaculum aegyptiacum TaxID=745377 RepID=A0A2Z2HXN6_9EURY|nr:hypothetical protein B1756_15535 [Natrarchaeobaculum aegyptiacum]
MTRRRRFSFGFDVFDTSDPVGRLVLRHYFRDRHRIGAVTSAVGRSPDGRLDRQLASRFPWRIEAGGIVSI